MVSVMALVSLAYMPFALAHTDAQPHEEAPAVNLEGGQRFSVGGFVFVGVVAAAVVWFFFFRKKV